MPDNNQTNEIIFIAEATGTNPVPSLPDFIKILHKDFQLRERDYSESSGNHRLAEINFMKSEINYLPIEGSEVVDSVIHEVLHGLFHMFDIGVEDGLEEHIVSALATGLTTIMRDNPSLMPALQEML